jgi:hypothetical protein
MSQELAIRLRGAVKRYGDSLDSFYARHEAGHPDIRVYASVSREFETHGPPAYPERVDAADWGTFVAERIAAPRAGHGLVA